MLSAAFGFLKRKLSPEEESSSAQPPEPAAAAEPAAKKALTEKTQACEDTITAPTAGSRSLPRMILLVGLPGSGKTTLAELLLRELGQDWTRISQDDLGSRDRCEELASEALQAGRSLLIDRCNHTRRQRLVWTALSRRFNLLTSDIVCIYLDVPMAVCLKRISQRTSHPTLRGGAGTSSARSATVLYELSRAFEVPVANSGEGFGKVTCCCSCSV
jgi:hypothetical protein